MKTAFRRLIHFEDSKGTFRFGEASQQLTNFEGQEVKVYEGSEPWEPRPNSTVATIAKVLSPLATTPVIYGIGLTYKAHLEETGFPTPKFPVYFSKAADALADPYQDIPIPKCIKNLDCEGELCFVIGRDVKDFTLRENPADYILGFMAGNDVSARDWQTQETAGGQHHVAKSFDCFAPVGPVLASYEAVSNPEKLVLETHVNGKPREHACTDDFLFPLKEMLECLSRGKTLRKGTIVMTGTPGGVAAFMKPQVWLQDGDVVEVNIEGLGTLRNKHVFIR